MSNLRPRTPRALRHAATAAQAVQPPAGGLLPLPLQVAAVPLPAEAQEDAEVEAAVTGLESLIQKVGRPWGPQGCACSARVGAPQLCPARRPLPAQGQEAPWQWNLQVQSRC